VKVLGTLAIVTGGAVAALAVYTFAWHTDARAQTARTRSCGALSVGIGWHLRASPKVSCSSARHLMNTYFRRGANRRTRALVLGYVCTKRDFPDGEHIRCVRAARLVTAKSFGY
jgi:hypothetical protein